MTDENTCQPSDGDSEVTTELAKLSDQFSARIEGLRELLEVITPHVAALDEPKAIKRIASNSGLSPEGQKIVADVLLGEDHGDDSESREKIDGSASSESQTDADRHSASTDSDDISPKVVEFANLVQDQPTAVLKVFHRLNQSRAAPRTSLLNGSLLTVAIASFEFLLAGLYKHHLLHHPKQLETEEKEFSLSDLIEMGSIQDARRALAERRTDAFMGKRLDEWSAWTKRILGRTFDDLCLDASHLNEMFQRRHIIVHSGGAVDRRYLQRVDLPPDERPKLGDDLPIPDAYLQHALDEIEVLGYGLIAVSRSKWHADEAEDTTSQLNHRIFDLMQAGRWTLAKRLADVGCTLDQPDQIQWMIQVNGWLSQKRLDEFDECRQEVIEWDITALENQFKLAKVCLLDEADKAFEYLLQVLESDEVMPGEIWDWPVLDDLRADPRFAQTFKQVGYERSPGEGDSADSGQVDA